MKPGDIGTLIDNYKGFKPVKVRIESVDLSGNLVNFSLLEEWVRDLDTLKHRAGLRFNFKYTDFTNGILVEKLTFIPDIS